MSIEKHLVDHRCYNLDRCIYYSKDRNQTLRMLRARKTLKGVELIMNKNGYLQRRLMACTVLRITETKGDSRKSYAITVAKFVELARLDRPELPIERQVSLAAARLEKENDAEITVEKEL